MKLAGYSYKLNWFNNGKNIPNESSKIVEQKKGNYIN